MNEILKTNEQMKTPIEIAIGVDENGMTTASKLYEFLELSPSNYSKWCRTNITENEFAEENVDFVRLVIKYESGVGTKEREDYKLTAHFAKKLSCKGNGEKAEQAREYFATIEERAKEYAINRAELSPQMQMLYSMIDAQAKMELRQKQQDKEMNAVREEIKNLEAKVTTHNDDYFTVAGYASLRGLNVDINKANMLGRKASKLSREYGYEISHTKDTRFGTVNTYHIDILKEVFKR